MIKTTQLTKSYGKIQALKGVNLAIPKGSVYGIVGENGAGKTTLLTIMAGLLNASSGTVTLDAPRREVAFCPDVPEFEPWLSVSELLRLAARLRRTPFGPADLDSALDTFGLRDVADRRLAGLSRGTTQRLSLAASMIGEPSILLLDEPCSSLDPEGRGEILGIISALGKKTTVIMSSHTLSDVETVCSNIGMLHEGELVWQGKLEYLIKDHLKPVWRIRLHGGAAAVAIVLRSQPWIVDVKEHGPNELEIEATDQTTAEEQIATALSRSHAALIALEPIGSDLEGIFVRIASSIKAEKKAPRRRPAPVEPAP